MQALALLKKAQTPQDYQVCVNLFTDAIAGNASKSTHFFSRGKCFLALHQYQRALFDFSMAIRLDSGGGNNVAKHIGYRGYCYRSLGRLQESLKDYNEAIRIGQGDNAQYYYERALVYYDLEEYENCISDFTLGLEKKLSPQQSYQSHFYRGIAHRKINELQKSVESLKGCLEIDATKSEGHNHLGLSYAQMGDYEAAKAAFSAALTAHQEKLKQLAGGSELEQPPEEETIISSKYLNNRGLACYHLSNYEEAAGDFTEAISHYGKDAGIFFNRGNAYFSMKKYDKALEGYETAIAHDEDNAVYYHHQGLAFQGLHAIQQAIDAYLQAIELDPTHYPSKFHLGIMYHVDGQYSRALEVFSGDIPHDQALYERRGLVFRDMGKYDLALSDFTSAIDLEENGRYYYHRGVVYLRMLQETEAIADFNVALQLGGRGPSFQNCCVYNDRGLAYRALGNLSRAIADLTFALQEQEALLLSTEVDKTVVNELDFALPTNLVTTEYFANRAQCFVEQGLYARAEQDLSKALQVDPKDPQLLYKRGIARYAQDFFQQAIDDLTASLEQGAYPQNLHDIYYHLGVSFANLGKHLFAVPAFDEAIKRVKMEDYPHYVHERAKSEQVIGEHEKALRDFSKVLEAQPNNARAYFRRGFSFKALRFYEEAAEDFEAAKECEPQDTRFVVNYRKLHNVQAINLGPSGHEDPKPKY